MNFFEIMAECSIALTGFGAIHAALVGHGPGAARVDPKGLVPHTHSFESDAPVLGRGVDLDVAEE